MYTVILQRWKKRSQYGSGGNKHDAKEAGGTRELWWDEHGPDVFFFHVVQPVDLKVHDSWFLRDSCAWYLSACPHPLARRAACEYKPPAIIRRRLKNVLLCSAYVKLFVTLGVAGRAGGAASLLGRHSKHCNYSTLWGGAGLAQFPSPALWWEADGLKAASPGFTCGRASYTA